MKISKGVKRRPFRLAIYGPPKVGKTSLCADLPMPVIIPVDKGADLIDCDRLPAPQSWDELLSTINSLLNEDHDYETVIVDGLGAVESLMKENIAKQSKVDAFGDIGYGKGYEQLVVGTRDLIDSLDDLRDERNMNWVIVGHATIKEVHDPEGPSYSHYTVDADEKRVLPVIKQSVDAILFLTIAASMARKRDPNDERKSRSVMESFGERIIRTEFSAAVEGGNRFNLSPEISCDPKEPAEQLLTEIEEFYKGKR